MACQRNSTGLALHHSALWLSEKHMQLRSAWMGAHVRCLATSSSFYKGEQHEVFRTQLIAVYLSTDRSLFAQGSLGSVEKSSIGALIEKCLNLTTRSTLHTYAQYIGNLCSATSAWWLDFSERQHLWPL
jgi:hypothetical protein